MKLVLSLGIGLLNLVALCGAAGAQTLRVPRVEVGGEAGMLVAIGEGLHPMPTAGPTVTSHISQQDAIELAADTIFTGSRSIYGLYFLQYRRATRGPSDWTGIRVLHRRNKAITPIRKFPSVARRDRMAPPSCTPRIPPEK